MKAALLLLLAGEIAAHKFEDVTRRIESPPGRPLAQRQRVLLFLHVAKCGGTSVREIFHRHKDVWHATYWSLSQRQYGFKANRILHGIHLALRQNHTRIFVEWHVAVNFSFVPTLRDAVLGMRPDVEFTSFCILRKPVNLLASNGAYWRPLFPADLQIMLEPDHLIFSVLAVPLSKVVGPADAAVQHNRSGLCSNATAGRDEAEHRLCLRVAQARFDEARRRKVSKELRNLSDATSVYHRIAEHDLTAVARRRAAAAGGCAPLVAAGLAMLAPIDHVLMLENNKTMEAVQLVARTGDPSFFWRPPPPGVRPGPTPHSAPNARSHLAPYKAREAQALAAEANACSNALHERLRQQQRRCRSASTCSVRTLTVE